MCRQWARTHADMESSMRLLLRKLADMESTGEHPSIMQDIRDDIAELFEPRVFPFGISIYSSDVFGEKALKIEEKMKSMERTMAESRKRTYEESRKEWDERTMDQVQASKLPSSHADVILARSSLIRKAFYERVRELEENLYHLTGESRSLTLVMLGCDYGCDWGRNRCESDLLTMNQMHNEAIGRVIVNLKVLLSAGTMRAEEYASLKPEVVERMYYAELEEMFAALKKVIAQMKAQAELLYARYAVVVSAISLLVFVYQYLIGHIDKGGTLTCSSGSFQFRATFISIVLFEGAYVWIKFRDPASGSTKGGYRRPIKDKLTGVIINYSKPEARYTPPGQSGNSIYLGRCDTDQEAQIKKKIVAFFYGQDEGKLELGDGGYFQIPPMSGEQEQGLSVSEKRDWVKDKVREVYGEYRKEVDIVRQIVAFYHGEGEGRLDLPHGKVFYIPLMSPEDAECVEKEILIEGKVREAYEGFRKERADHNQHINPSQVETDRSVDGPSTGVPLSFDHHALDPHPQQESDAVALLTAMVTDLQNRVTDSQNMVTVMLEERWQMLQQGEHWFQATMLTMTELQQEVKDKDQSYQECLQKNEALQRENEALQRMLEVKDRRISESEQEVKDKDQKIEALLRILDVKDEDFRIGT